MKSLISVLLLLVSSPVLALTLAEWNASFENPTVQQAIIQQACGAQSRTSTVDAQGLRRFTNGSSWLRLAASHVFSNKPRFLVVVCEKGREGQDNPMSAVTMLLIENNPPTPLTDGYARRERVSNLEIPGLKKPSLLAIERAFSDPPLPYGKGSLVDLSDPFSPRFLWQSGVRMPDVHWGVGEVDGQAPAEIVARFFPPVRGDVYSGAGVQTWAFRWNGTRFEPYETFEEKLKALPDNLFTLGNP